MQLSTYWFTDNIMKNKFSRPIPDKWRSLINATVFGFKDANLHLKRSLPSRGNLLTVGFSVTVSVPAFDVVLPARFVASQWYVPECCSFVIERRTKYEIHVLSF